jgi:hypothetical protein
MLMLIARSADCGHSRAALRKLGFSDRRIALLQREVTALGPKLGISEEEKASIIRESAMLGAATVSTFSGFVPFISGMPVQYQIALALTAVAFIARPLVRNLLHWALNPGIRRELALQRSSDEVERYKSLLLGSEPQVPERVSGLEDPLMRSNLTAIGRAARTIASYVPFTRQRMIRKVERKVKMQVMAERIRSMLERDDAGLPGPSGDASPGRPDDPFTG